MKSPRTATKGSPYPSQLEKAGTQQRKPNAAKNKLKKKKTGHIEFLLGFKTTNSTNLPDPAGLPRLLEDRMSQILCLIVHKRDPDVLLCLLYYN